VVRKVDSDGAVHYCFTIKGFFDGFGDAEFVEDYYYAREGLEGTPCVDCAIVVDDVADCLEVFRFENCWVVEASYYYGV